MGALSGRATGNAISGVALMQWIAGVGWGLAVAMSIAVGFAGGKVAGSELERSTVAARCRNAGAFAHKRTGFKCEVKRVDR